MTEKRQEQLSAFMDGESDVFGTKAVVDRLTTDSDMRVCWQRYHLIGDVMRNTLPGKSTSSVASRVSLALKQEPTILSPDATPEKKTPNSKQHRHPIGYAVAASVAVVGFLTVGVISQQADNPMAPTIDIAASGSSAIATTASMASSAPATLSAKPVVVNVAANGGVTASARTPGVVLASNESEFKDDVSTLSSTSPKLQQWVWSHEYSSSNTARHGVPPNVRLVTFSNGVQSSQ